MNKSNTLVSSSKAEKGSMASKLVMTLFDALASKNVECCVWKGSYDIDDILLCKDDIDLLIKRSDTKNTLSVLNELGFKRAIASKSREQLGIDEYYAYDENLEKFVHVQLYYQLILGERLIENHHLPIEKAMLADVVNIKGIPFANPAMELIVFVLRKYIQMNVTFLVRPGASRKISLDVTKEFDYLLERTEMTSIESCLAQNFPAFDKLIIKRCLENMGENLSIIKWLHIRYSLTKSLRAFKRKSSFFAFISWLNRRFYVFKDKNISAYKAYKIPNNGGFSIAIIGSDGSGKSTAINYLSEWLGTVYKARYFHMGRPPPSLATSLLSRFGILILPIVCKTPSKEAGALLSSQWPVMLQWLPRFLLLSIARDRYRLYLKIQRACNLGVIALIDRYPVNEIKQMDCARMHTLPGSSRSSMFAEMEEQYYKKILSPDMILLLVVDPEVAASRQPGDGHDYVIRRATEIQEISNKLSKSVDIIDSSATLHDVKKQLRSLLWRAI